MSCKRALPLHILLLLTHETRMKLLLSAQVLSKPKHPLLLGAYLCRSIPCCYFPPSSMYYYCYLKELYYSQLHYEHLVVIRVFIHCYPPRDIMGHTRNLICNPYSSRQVQTSITHGNHCNFGIFPPSCFAKRYPSRIGSNILRDNPAKSVFDRHQFHLCIPVKMSAKTFTRNLCWRDCIDCLILPASSPLISRT